MENILINGQAYDFTQVILKIAGLNMPSVSAIDYNEEQAKENNYGAGTRPVSRGRGKIDANGSITLSMNDIEKLRDVAPDGSLLKIKPFDVQVSFMNSQKVVTHILKNCEFTNDGFGGQTDDKDFKKALSIVMSNVKYR